MKIIELLSENETNCNECPYAGLSEQEITEKKLPPPTASQCAAKRLSNVRYAQCVGRGLRAHDSGHTDGTGKQGVKGSGKEVKGKKASSEKFGGKVKNYGGKHS